MAVATELFDSYFTEHPHVLEAYIASAVAFPLGTVVAPALVGGLVERVKAGATFDDVKLRVLILLGIVAVGFIVNMLQQYANVEVGTSFRVHVRKEIIERVMRSRAYSYHSVDIPETIYKLIELPDSLAYMLNLFKDIGPAMATIVAMFVYFTWLSAQTKNPCIAGTILLYVLFMWGSVAYNAHVSIPRLVTNTGEYINLYNRSGDVLEVLPHTLAIAATSEEATRHSDMVVQHMAHVQETHNHMVEIQIRVWNAVAGAAGK
jgi:ABC-type multidrug transport system fused ATPase/permease subunit